MGYYLKNNEGTKPSFVYAPSGIATGLSGTGSTTLFTKTMGAFEYGFLRSFYAEVHRQDPPAASGEIDIKMYIKRRGGLDVTIGRTKLRQTEAQDTHNLKGEFDIQIFPTDVLWCQVSVVGALGSYEVMGNMVYETF